MKFQLYDVVRLAMELPEKGLQVGSKGAIVLVYDDVEKPHYEVEFSDDQGVTLALVTLAEDALEALEGP